MREYAEGAAAEIGGADPLDEQFVGPGLDAQGPAIGIRAPTLLFVPLGALLGPWGLGLLASDALAHFDPVISAGLAALGIFTGLALDLRQPVTRELLVPATVEALGTMAVVAAAAWYLLGHWQVALPEPAWAVPAVLAVGAAASAGALAETPLARRAARIADLDDAAPLLAGAAVLALVATGAPWAAAAHLLTTAALGLAGALACGILFERAHGAAERGVFVLGSVLLLGGIARQLDASPLLAGAVAGVFWRWSPGGADTVIAEDMRRFRHPLVALLLLGCGALLQPSTLALWLLVPFLVFRLWGKVAGAWLARRAGSGLRTAELASHLLAPGVLGVAFALAYHLEVPSPVSAAVLGAVAGGSLASELAALVAGSRR